MLFQASPGAGPAPRSVRVLIMRRRARRKTLEERGCSLASVPGLPGPRSVRVLIMRMRKRQTFEERGSFPLTHAHNYGKGEAWNRLDAKTRTERGRPGTEATNAPKPEPRSQADLCEGQPTNRPGTFERGYGHYQL